MNLRSVKTCGPDVCEAYFRLASLEESSDQTDHQKCKANAYHSDATFEFFAVGCHSDCCSKLKKSFAFCKALFIHLRSQLSCFRTRSSCTGGESGSAFRPASQRVHLFRHQLRQWHRSRHHLRD